MSKSTEQDLGLGLLYVLNVVGFFVVTRLRKPKRVIGAPVVAALVAYTCYVAAALTAGAEFPGFLREHLFDGLAPAAVVAFLVNAIPVGSWDTALPWIRRPVMIPVVFCIGGVLIFGLIAAAAVFSSGSNDFLGKPVGWCALAGGSLFLFSVFEVAGPPRRPGVTGVRWLFEKRPKRAAIPGPGGSGEPPA